MEFFSIFKEVSSLIQWVIFTLIVVILYRNGILQLLLNKNGNGKHKELEELKEQIAEMNENHLHEINNKLDKIVELLIEIKTKVDKWKEILD